MGLRSQAEADLGVILENEDDFGFPITLTDPSGEVANLIGFTHDISEVIDPNTGTAVTGRDINVSLRTGSILDENLAIPQGVADTDKKPWMVKFNDLEGQSGTYKVRESRPDRQLGVVVLICEFYEELVV